jgi:L-lysine exporter family protein LysE/ArgO
MTAAFLSGFLVSLSLILAIGAQNAFVLRQGLRREHVGWVVLVCALSDAVLIVAGVAGFGLLSAKAPWLGEAMRYAGAAFLLAYGALRFRAALRGGEALVPAAAAPASLSRVVGTTLLLTWANPHVYLDTLMLIGSIAAQYAPHGAAFGTGAALASAVFFSALGFGARLLAPLFARPAAWVVLEVIVGVTMWAIALGLIVRG